MAKNKRLSRDQKRKAKLADRTRRSGKAESLAYAGNKYKTDEFAPLVFRTELGVHEADVLSDRRLTDRQVEAAFTKLIGQLRSGPLPPLDSTSRGRTVEGQEEDLIIWRVRSNWEDLFATEPRRGPETLIGILRTLLNSVDTWGTPTADSRGYLRFLQGFMRNAGAEVRAVDAGGRPLPAPVEPELLRLGRAWCENRDPKAAAAFTSLADRLLRSGRAAEVVEIAQQLLGEYAQAGKEVTLPLSALSLQAQEIMRSGTV